MSPFIQKGDWLTVKPSSFSEIRVGDIAVYGNPGEEEETLTTHRVLKKEGKGRPRLLTGGDAGGWAVGGAPVYPEQIYGRVVKIERGKRVVNLDHPWARFYEGVRVRWMLRRTWISGVLQDPQRIPRWLQKRLSIEIQRGSLVLKKEKVLVQKLGEETFLIPVFKGVADMEKIFSLSPLGARILEWLDERKPVKEIHRLITAEFNVPPAQAEADCAEFLNQLSQTGLLSEK